MTLALAQLVMYLFTFNDSPKHHKMILKKLIDKDIQYRGKLPIWSDFSFSYKIKRVIFLTIGNNDGEDLSKVEEDIPYDESCDVDLMGNICQLSTCPPSSNHHLN